MKTEERVRDKILLTLCFADVATFFFKKILSKVFLCKLNAIRIDTKSAQFLFL
jgi:hypothetical protein